MAACLDGQQQAWSALVEKYKNLVYSIAFKYGARQDDAKDLFQSIWLDVFLDLGKLRKRAAIRSWLISLASNKSYQWKQASRRIELNELPGSEPTAAVDTARLPPEELAQVERDQTVREAIHRLDPNCQEMIRLLFYSNPRLPYKAVAERLGITRGSVSFLRGRCLQRLEKHLKKLGLENVVDDAGL